MTQENGNDGKKDGGEDPPIPRGLRNRATPAKYPRPASGPGGSPPRPVAAIPRDPIAIRDHRALATAQAAIAERINADPDFSVMLLINPVMALDEMGVKLSPQIRSHILHALQHPTALRTRRDELEQKLTSALGEAPRPNDEEWTAHFLFVTRKIKPLAIGDAKPLFKAPLNADIIRNVDKLRPPATKRYPQPRLIAVKSSTGTRPWQEAVRRLDLDAPVPALPPADRAPDKVPLEDLWFYKDLDPVVHDVLELGIVQRSSFPFLSPDRFRKILDGTEQNAFRSWIRAVRFEPSK
jgi:hypothetical protein